MLGTSVLIFGYLTLFPLKCLILHNIWKNCDKLKADFYGAILAVGKFPDELNFVVCFTLSDNIQIHLRREKKFPVLEICVNFFRTVSTILKPGLSGGKSLVGGDKGKQSQTWTSSKTICILRLTLIWEKERATISKLGVLLHLSWKLWRFHYKCEAYVLIKDIHMNRAIDWADCINLADCRNL